jgi:hypothetical protein
MVRLSRQQDCNNTLACDDGMEQRGNPAGLGRKFRIGGEGAGAAAAIGRNFDGDSFGPAPGGVVEEMVKQEWAKGWVSHL